MKIKQTGRELLEGMRAVACEDRATPARAAAQALSAAVGWTLTVPSLSNNKAVNLDSALQRRKETVTPRQRIENLMGYITATRDQVGFAKALQSIEDALVTAEDGWHMANGVADLAMKHRDAAELEMERLRAAYSREHDDKNHAECPICDALQPSAKTKLSAHNQGPK